MWLFLGGGGFCRLQWGRENIGGGGGGLFRLQWGRENMGGGPLPLAVCGSVRVLAFVCAYVLSTLYWAYATSCYGML